MNGHLEIFCGPMFSGKTSTLLSKLSKFAECGLQVLYLNHDLDNRTTSNFSTHCKMIKNTVLNFDSMKIKNIDEINFDSLKAYDVIGCDEIQFYGKSIIPFVLKLVEDFNKHVIVVGLDSTSERKKFGYILDLIPFANSVTKMTAACKRCFKKDGKFVDAIFTHRISESKETVLIGASGMYDSTCRSCYLELNSGD